MKQIINASFAIVKFATYEKVFESNKTITSVLLARKKTIAFHSLTDCKLCKQNYCQIANLFALLLTKAIVQSHQK